LNVESSQHGSGSQGTSKEPIPQSQPWWSWERVSQGEDGWKIWWKVFDKLLIGLGVLVIGNWFSCSQSERSILAQYQESIFAERLACYEELIRSGASVRERAFGLYAREACLLEHGDVLTPILLTLQQRDAAGRWDSLQVVTRASDLAGALVDLEKTIRSNPLYVADSVAVASWGLIESVRRAMTEMDPNLFWTTRGVRGTRPSYGELPPFGRSDSLCLILGEVQIALPVAIASTDEEAIESQRMVSRSLDAIADSVGTNHWMVMCSRSRSTHGYDECSSLRRIDAAYRRLLALVKQELRINELVL
jgi:hypothetical protein